MMKPSCVLLFALSAFSFTAFAQFPSIDGIGNNAANPSWGATDGSFARITPPNYVDNSGWNITQTPFRPRWISNDLFGAAKFAYTSTVSAMHAAWGQFVAHDMIRTINQDPPEWMNMSVPTGDPRMDPFSQGNRQIYMRRTRYSSFGNSSSPRVLLNGQTAFVDASVVYGPSVARSLDIRTMQGGKLIADPVVGLPFNTKRLFHEGCGVVPGCDCSNRSIGCPLMRMSGDERANQNPGLIVLQGLFVLEHNRWCDVLAARNPSWGDEMLYQEARKRVHAIFQSITFYEYLPLIIGRGLPTYSGYKPNVDPRMDGFFSVAAYRYGHAAVNSLFWRLNQDGSVFNRGHLLLRANYFNAAYLSEPGSFDAIFRGLVAQPEKKVNPHLVTDVRDFLDGLREDLASFNIMRGRDFGLPFYSDARRFFNLSVPNSFANLTEDAQVAALLQLVYTPTSGTAPDLSKVDPWVGGLAEPHIVGGLVGPLFAASILEQMTRVRDGDRFYFENPDQFNETERMELRNTRLADVIVRNTGVRNITDVFRVGTFFPPVPEVNFADRGAFAAVFRLSANEGNEFSMRWTMADEGVSFELVARNEGYLGLGINSVPGRMVGAQAAIARLDGSNSPVRLHRLRSQEVPGIVLEAPSVQTALSNVALSRQGGVTTVRFTVRYRTDGDAENSFTIPRTGPVNLIWSMGNSDALAYHGDRRGFITIDFSSGAAEAAFGKAQRNRMAHGALMTISWGFLFPLGIICARFLKHKGPIWFKLHQAIQWLGVLVSTIGVIIIFVTLSPSHFNEPGKAHKIIGMIVMILGWLQPLNAALRPHPPEQGETKSLRRLFWEFCHKYSGRAASIASFAVIFMGIWLIHSIQIISDMARMAWFGVQLALMMLFGVIYIWRTWANEAPAQLALLKHRQKSVEMDYGATSPSAQ